MSARRRTAQPATAPPHPAGALLTLRRLVRLVRVQRAFAAMMAFGLASITLNVLGPWLLGRATDLVLAGVLGGQTPRGVSKADAVEQLRQQGRGPLAAVLQATDFQPGQVIDLAAVGRILALVLAVYAVSGLCWMLQGRQATAAIQRAGRRLRAEIDAKLARLPVAHFDNSSRGDLTGRVTNDVDNVVQTLQQTLSQLTNSLLLIVGILGMMFWISPVLAVIAVVVVPAAIAVTTALGRRSQPRFDAQWAATGDLNAHVEEVCTGHAVVKAHGRADRFADEFRARNEAVFEAAYPAQFVSGVIQPAMTFVNNLGYVLVAVIGCLRVLSGAVSVGEVQAFIQYSRQLSGPLTQITTLVGVVQSGIASARRVFELLDAEEEAPDAPAATPSQPGVRGRVHFDAVSFRYRPERPVLDNVSFSTEPGRTVAIVGPTGAGKTTLVNLLLRFYDVTEGRITLDGRDIRLIPRHELRNAIGMVPQDAWLFVGTIADNIGYGRPGATRADIEAAARAAHADHVIATLPAGYDTVVGADGNDLSSGERQLITIARTFLADPPILVLDEATSAVDSRTELLIRTATHRLSRGRTCFVIAHRLATVRDADVILVMEGGAIAEQGSDAELRAAGGSYARLYRAQFDRPTVQIHATPDGRRTAP